MQDPRFIVTDEKSQAEYEDYNELKTKYFKSKY